MMFQTLPERVRVLLGLTVALPLAAALIAATLAYGSEFRRAAETRALGLADSLLARVTLADSLVLLERAAAAGYDAALYVHSNATSFRRVAGSPERFGDATLEARAARRLLREAAGVAIRPLGGRTSVLTPIPDARAGGLQGALLLVHHDPVPSSLPELPLLLGLATLALTLLATAAYARAPRIARAVLVFLPPIVFGAVITAAFPIAPGGGAYRHRAIIFLALWAVVAAIGLSRVRGSSPHHDGQREVHD